TADTPGDLAGRIGLDAVALNATIAEARRAATGDGGDAHGRRDFGLGALDQRLYACRIVPRLFHSQGGLALDLDGRLLDRHRPADRNPVRRGRGRRRALWPQRRRGICFGKWALIGNRAWPPGGARGGGRTQGRRIVTLSRQLVGSIRRLGLAEIPAEVVRC